nr:hypothetical protein GPVRGNEL_GPVRGNEL_CDS_0005 [Caudoviricetes sp.]
MAIEFKKTAVKGHTPEIWRGECKMLPGGFKPKNNIATGTVLHRGVLVEVDFEEMSAAVIKVAKILAGSTTTKPRIAKGHLFAIGDVVTKNGDGSKTPTITAIDTTNADYDTLTLSDAYTGLAENDVIVESKAVSSGSASAKYTPNMVVGAVKEFNGKGLPTIDAAYEAVVLYPSLDFPLLSEWLNGCCLKSNPNILFIKQ